MVARLGAGPEGEVASLPHSHRAHPRDRFNRPLTDLRISVIDACNFRCQYCMPEDRFPENYRFLRRRELLSDDELERLARLFVAQGVRKLRLTGGEPLLRPGIAGLVRRLAAIPLVTDLALTTNGSRLVDLAGELHQAGLQRLTVSLDSLDPEVFGRMNGRGISPQVVLDGIAAAEAAGFKQLKINAVIQRGVNEESILPLARHFRGTGHILRFIEYMDVGQTNGWKPTEVLAAREILARVHAEWPLREVGRHQPGDVAERYEYLDGLGELGVIASITQPFCGACSRARLSADGRFYTCLFAPRGLDLRGPLRAGADDTALTGLIRGTWRERRDKYSEERIAGAGAQPRAEMYQLGG
jgi:GTP 3',8-cyclase